LKKEKRYISYFIFLILLLFFQEIHVEASSLQGNLNITLSPDGKAFTTNAGDTNYTWYPNKHTIYTGVNTSLRTLEEGEHTYQTSRNGIIPIERWEVNHVPGQCIHDSHVLLGYYHGISYGKSKCKRPYNSGWFGYCADCKRQVNNMLIYMNESTAYTIKDLNLNLDYYYLCPYDGCNNLEQGRDFEHHYCDQISWNRYYIVYRSNLGSGYMHQSTHMYKNETIYENVEFTPDIKLRKNTYSRVGFEFIGWNTKQDGTGDWFNDEQKILNLTKNNNETVYLYAQWKKSESTLHINPNGGSYSGNTGITSVKQDYNSTYLANPSNITPPTGYKVSFNSMGGNSVSDIVQTLTFREWKQSLPFVGKLEGNTYTYLGSQGKSDTITAQYTYNSITLPATSRSGYSLGGWYYDTSCTSLAGKAGDKITPTSNLTLYAQWVGLILYSTDNYSANSGKGAVDLSWNQNDGYSKVYMLYQSRDKTNWTKISGVSDISNSNSVNLSYEYSGGAGKYTVPYTGTYTITLYGAQGSNYSSYSGGLGGMVTARIFLYKGEVLTYNIGGQAGYNGGGSASKYGKGGGCTTLSSSLKGNNFLIAGGGGGATMLQGGAAGGSAASVQSSGLTGGSGEAGGGGGYRGGTAGAAAYHVHAASCKHTHTGSSASGGGCYTSPIRCAGTNNRVMVKQGDIGGYYCGNCGHGPMAHSPGNPGCGNYSAKEWRYPDTYNYICNTCGLNYGESNPGSNCTRVNGYAVACGKSESYVCGKTLTYVETNTRAYGGSNYINTSHMVSYSEQSGVRSGNGRITIVADSIGYQNSLSLGGVIAQDYAAPDPVDITTVVKQALSGNQIKVTWKEPMDKGTKYYHMAKSFKAGTLEGISTSNITENTLVSKLNGYYYVINTSPGTAVTTSASKLTTAAITINLTADLQYLHVACIDKAGNMSSTTHIPIGKADPEVAWNVFTEQIWITQQDSVHPAAQANTYFVRCNGNTPFILKYNSYLDGSASDRYQINHSIFEYQTASGAPVQIQVTTPSIPITYETVTKTASDLIKNISGEMLIMDAGYTVTERSNWCRNLSIVQKFTMQQEADGRKIRLTPIAGADFKSSTIYSNYNNDIGNSIYLIGDCTPPEIKGLEELDKITVIDMEEDDYTLTFTASDSGSGVREFYAIITNLDNGINEKFVSDNGSSLTMSITDDKALFVGDFEVVLYAVDNVGNVASESSGATEFTLKAHISRVLSPHEPVFKRGESGILHITTTGYVNKVEVIFPDKLLGLNPDLNQTYVYEVPSYIQIEEYEFVIPLYAPEEGYEVIVKAYKNGTTLEERPKFSTVEITGSILDEIRVRIR